MILSHLRSNVVAYLALLLALTSTSYAAVQIADGSVTTKKLAKNAVTSPKIKKSAVKASDVKDKSLTSADLAAGVVPGDAAVFTHVFGQVEPEPTPDSPDIQPFTFSLPRAGTVEVRFFSASFGSDCTAGASFVGLYVDGKPVAHAAAPSFLQSNPGRAELLGLINLPAGAHTAAIRANCPTGDWNGTGAQWAGWEVSLLSE